MSYINDILKEIAKPEEIESFLSSSYYNPDELDEDNTINDFNEYIQDSLDWELFMEVIPGDEIEDKLRRQW